MRRLCMDSAHKNLVIGLYEGNQMVAGVCLESWKKQSETLFPELIRLCEEANWSSDDIQEVVITDGPGSYTGVRIAMSVAKVLCTRKNIPLYVISTLQLYAGLATHAMSLIDARSHRCYVGLYDHGKLVQDECIMDIDEIKQLQSKHHYNIYGDGSLIDEKANTIDFLDNFIRLLPYARKVENIHTLVPRYLKDQDAYKVK